MKRFGVGRAQRGDLDKEIDGKKKGWATQSIKVKKLVRNWR
jgi:hypothetical protein